VKKGGRKIDKWVQPEENFKIKRRQFEENGSAGVKFEKFISCVGWKSHLILL